MTGEIVETISVRKANRQFCSLVRRVEQEGVGVRILRRNKPVALLVPVPGQPTTGKARLSAIVEMKRLMAEGIALDVSRTTRNDLHSR